MSTNSVKDRQKFNGSGSGGSGGAGSTGAISRRPITAIIGPVKKPLATITNQPGKMDYNPPNLSPNNYVKHQPHQHCHHPSGAVGNCNAVSPNNKQSTKPLHEGVTNNGGGGVIVDACTTTTLAATKGSKHKALPNGNALLENGMGGVNRLVRVNDQQMSPESTTAATNGHSHHPHHHHQRYHYHQEALENVMPLSNNNHLHSVQNNNSQRYFNGQNGQQQLENGLKKDSQNGFHNGQSSSPQQPTGCLKATLLDNKSMTSNGQIVARGHSLATTMRTKWPVDNGHDEVTDSNELNGTEQHSMTPTSMRRIRNRSESSPAKEECKSNGTTRGNLQDSKSEDHYLKRSREDMKTFTNGLATNGDGLTPNRSQMATQRDNPNTNHTKLKFANELYIEEVKLAHGDCDKELVSPPAKVSTKSVVSGGLLDALKLNKEVAAVAAESDQLAESEYSSLDDEEEDDEFGEETTANDELLEEDVYDAMTAEDKSSSSDVCSGNAIVKQLPGTVSECVIGGVSSSTSGVPFSQSLFPHVPLYFSFANYLEAGPTLPACISKLMKWKLTPVTPVVVRKVLIHTGFRLLKQTNDWMGIWGKHMKSPQFRTIRSYQKYNHIPGSFQIGRKDRVWRNLENQIRRNGKKEFGFMPRTYILPQDLKCLRQMWPKYSQQNVKWIIKPPASARGVGIKVINRWSQIPKRKPIIVQRYVERPLLIQGNKFDLRLYVLVTSINPLRIYLHTDGLARFASVRYSEKADTLSDRYMHLTNYSINKLSANYAKNEDADSCQGHKWTLRSLWQYLEGTGVNTERLWGTLRNLIIRTLLAGETPINNLTKANILSKYNCFELFGFDVLLDSDLSPWLLEVNISPSLHSASPLDLCVKGPLVQAVLNTAMYQVPPKVAAEKQSELLEQMGLPPDQVLCHDKRIYTTQLSRDERVKHNRFVNKEMTREEYLDTILQDLTSDDVRCLINTEDELARCSPLERIFPAPNTHAYLDFTENPRYYNRLLDAWETKYSKRRPDAISLLREKCERKVHLEVPPNQPSARKDSNNKSATSPAKNGGGTGSTAGTYKLSGNNQNKGNNCRRPEQEMLNTTPNESYRESSVESISTTTSTLSECTRATTPSIFPLSTSSSGSNAMRATDITSSFSSISSQLLLEYAQENSSKSSPSEMIMKGDPLVLDPVLANGSSS